MRQERDEAAARLAEAEEVVILQQNRAREVSGIKLKHVSLSEELSSLRSNLHTTERK